jgi:2-polyprenyl-6-methoxyphenol hydroxylase-like FAD-dependent oxidoreductase
MRQIPREKIFMNKKVPSFEQNHEGAMIRCHDIKSHNHGGILVGADGTYSAVREHLYKVLQAKKVLSKSDSVPLPFTCIYLVRQAEVLGPEEFLGLKLPRSQISSILGNGDYSVRVLCLPFVHNVLFH